MTKPTTEELKDLLGKVTGADFRQSSICGYFVTREGDVISTHPWRGSSVRKLLPHPNSHGYLCVTVKVEGGSKKMMVHTEVCKAFNGDKDSPDLEVRHLDGDRKNNHADNLKWGTRSENAIDRVNHGRCTGAKHGKESALVTGHRVMLTRPDGSTKEYISVNSVKKDGFSRTTVGRLAREGIKDGFGNSWQFIARQALSQK